MSQHLPSETEKRLSLIAQMSADDMGLVIAWIAGYAPAVFDDSVAACQAYRTFQRQQKERDHIETCECHTLAGDLKNSLIIHQAKTFRERGYANPSVDV